MTDKTNNGAFGPGASSAYALAQGNHKSLFLLTADAKEALRWQADLEFFHPGEEVLLFPSPDTLPYYQLSSNPDVARKRLGMLSRLVFDPQPVKMVIPLHAALRRIMPRNVFHAKSIQITPGQTLERDAFVAKLSGLGYERSPIVQDPGTFAVRGGVMDVYSPAHDNPFRLEFFGDEVESVRFFNPETQKTIAPATVALIIPARELLIEDLPENWPSLLKKRADARDIPKPERDRVQENLETGIYSGGVESFLKLFYPEPGSLFDYLPQGATVCVASPLLAELAEGFLAERRTQQEASTSPERMMKPEEMFLTRAEYEENLSYFGSCTASVEAESNIAHSQLLRSRKGPELMDELARLVREKRDDEKDVFIVTSSASQRERVTDLLARHDILISNKDNSLAQASVVRDALSARGQMGVHVLIGPISGGFTLPHAGQWWLTDDEIFGEKSRKKPPKPEGEAFSSFSDLKKDDYVVHQSHGVGRFLGLVNLEIGGLKNDFLLLEYLGGDKLYVPVDQIGMIYRYTAQEGVHPMLDKMGSGSWAKTREKVKKAARRLARELLDMQAKRKAARGFAFSGMSELYEEFEAEFPFEETEDQLKAIHDVAADMESDRPMDRLVCGDVGYGKTEVAMRAAFKAVIDHKQVVVLVPTTVLALQHFENFKKRFEKHSITIALMSRFQTAAEQKEIAAKLKEGAVDVVIGTHRLLSKDIGFRDLGLLIVDEEHRFGVAQKERIKKFQNLVDILSLTATPIPRSLNFALVGIRDLSVINTPPADRLAVRTYVTHFDDTTLKDAIHQEVRRGGQVFFVHNRVQTLPMIHDRLKRIVPDVTIGWGHGQMPEEDLEKVMLDFMHKKFDVLLSTTIVESGIDIPSANTIIIDRADTFGLAQLYQLRGRVGRSNHRAHCYLLIPFDKVMTNDARKRLDVIQRFTELGSGFKIAAHDLEIRGAGNILGPEQSGHIATVGYDLYVKLLEEAVESLKMDQDFVDIITEVKLPMESRIPDDMVPDPALRLTLYKQLSTVKADAGFDAIFDEWTDRFGVLPRATDNLIRLMRLKFHAHQLKITSLSYQKESLVLEIHPTSPIQTDAFLDLVRKSPKTYQFLRDGRFMAKMPHKSDKDLLDGITGLLRSWSEGR